MTRASLKLPVVLLGLVALHEVALRMLSASQLPSVLFAPGAHTPPSCLALTIGFLGLRLVAYIVVPFLAGAWVAARGLELLSAAVDRRASDGASHSPASPWRTTAPARRPHPPRASHPRSSR